MLLQLVLEDHDRRREGVNHLISRISSEPNTDRLLLHADDEHENGYSAELNDLFKAVDECDESEVSAFVAMGIDLDAPKFGITALQRAAMHGHTKICKILIDGGAEVNKSCMNDVKPLHFAAGKGHTDTVDLLLSYGSDINAQDSHVGRTPLHWAAQYGRSNTVLYLLLRNCDTSVENKKGQTAYSMCLEMGNSKADTTPYRKSLGSFLSYQYFRELQCQHLFDWKNQYLPTTDESLSHIRQLQKNGNRHDVFKKLLHIPGMGKLQQSSDIEKIHSKVCNLAARTCEKIREIDESFACGYIMIGSSSCDLKCSFPNEFDFFFVLNVLSDNCESYAIQENGTAKVKLQEKISKSWSKFVSNERYLSVSVKEAFTEILCQAMAGVLQEGVPGIIPNTDSAIVQWNKICTCFKLKIETEEYGLLPISIDISPAIEISMKPSNATCFYPTGFDYFHLVPKPSSSGRKDTNLLWCISCAAAETKIIKRLNDEQKTVAVLAKILLDYRLYSQHVPPAQLITNIKAKMRDEVFSIDALLRTEGISVTDLYIKLKYMAEMLIDSYVTKVAFLNEIKLYKYDADWTEDKFQERLISMFEYIVSCCTNGCLPSPMLEDVNILQHSKHSDLQMLPTLYAKQLCAYGILNHLKTGNVPVSDGILEPECDMIWSAMRPKLNAKHNDDASKVEEIHIKFLKVWDAVEKLDRDIQCAYFVENLQSLV